MFLYIFLILWINICYAKDVKNVAILLVTAPKKRPELTRSASDLLVALKNIPDNIAIKEIVFTKGCVEGCEHVELDNVVKQFKEEFPHITISTPTFVPDDDDLFMDREWSRDYYSGLFDDIRVGDFYYERYLKHIRINFFFISSAKYLYNKADIDYVLFMEDDLTYQPDAFINVGKLIERTNSSILYSKIAHTHRRGTPYSHLKDFVLDCRIDVTHRVGYYGILRSREQLKIYLTHMKFCGLTECGDTLSKQLCQASDKMVSVIECTKHFGPNKRMPK